MKKYILVLNAGSATLKFKIFDFQSLKEKIAGNFERVGLANSFLIIGKKRWNFGKIKNHEQALRIVLGCLQSTDYGLRSSEIKVIGHRVVHGGEEFFRPVIVTLKIWQRIARYSKLAPLHNPSNLVVIRFCFKLFPGVKNVAVFDTGFYKDLKPEVFLYALPLKYYTQHHIRRYGFHGISHGYVAKEVAKILRKPLKKLNLITCHFGNGDSITAIKKDKPIDTTMGFTPLEGLTMGTRSGDLDPSVPLYLIQKLKMKPDEVNDLLNKKSGLLAISGFTSDMREILAASGHKVFDFKLKKKYTKEQKKRAKLALAMFIYDVQRYISAYTGLLGKVDAFVFTGGIGERSPVIRKLALKGLKFIKKPKFLVIKTDEELAIAREVKKLI